MKWRELGFLGAGIVVALLIGGAFLMLTRQQPVPAGTAPPPIPWKVDSGAPPADLQQMEQAVKDATPGALSLRSDEGVALEGVKVSGEWAIAGGPIRNTKTGAISGAEGLLVILRKVQGQWQAAYPGTPTFEAWLDQVPDSLLSPETKKFLK